MSDHPARRLWATLETIHDVAYFAPGVRDAGVGLGLRGFWMTYSLKANPLRPCSRVLTLKYPIAGCIVRPSGGWRHDRSALRFQHVLPADCYVSLRALYSLLPKNPP